MGEISSLEWKLKKHSAIRMMKPYGGQHRGIWGASLAHPIRALAPVWCKPFLYTNQSRAQFDLNQARWLTPPGHLYCNYNIPKQHTPAQGDPHD
jgi:hypothetical protein